MPEILDEVVAANVRRLREHRGLSQARVSELAVEAGYRLSEVAVWGLENGRRRIRVVDLYALGAALEVAPDVLLRGDFQPGAVRPAVAYLVAVDGGTQEVLADESFVDDDQWINFYLRGDRVFFAPSTHVQYCRRIGEASNDR